MLRVIFVIVAVVVRGFEVRVMVTLPVVFLTVAFLGTNTAFGAMERAITAIWAGALLKIAGEAPVFLTPVLAFAAAGLAALDFVLATGFLLVGMAVKEKSMERNGNGRRTSNGSGSLYE